MLIFGTRLKAVRLEQKCSQKEVAELLGVTVRAYQYYEEGKREPNYDRLVALAQHLKVSTDYLLGLTNTRL